MNRPVAVLLLTIGASVPLCVLHAQCPDGTPPPCAGSHPTTPLIAVLPFENRSRDTADAYLAATFSEDVASALNTSHAVRLAGLRGARQGNGYLLSGSVSRGAGSIRVTARLEQSASGAILWSTTLERPTAQAAALPGLVARTTLDRVTGRTIAAPVMASVTRPDSLAYDLSLRARYQASLATTEGIERAMALWDQALSRDSSFAAGWAGLAYTLYSAHLFALPIRGIPSEVLVAREIDAAGRALALDSLNAGFWLARANALVDVDPTSRGLVLQTLRRALRRDSLLGSAWQQLAAALADSGDYAGAVAAARRAVAIQPGQSSCLRMLAQDHYWAGSYDSAGFWIDSAVAADPTGLNVRRWAGTIALALVQLGRAEGHYTAARAVGPGPERIWALAGLAVVAAARADTTRARSLTRSLDALADSLVPNNHVAVFQAWAHVAIGDGDGAIAALRRYQPAGDLHFRLHLLHDRPLDPLRNDARYQARHRPADSNAW